MVEAKETTKGMSVLHNNTLYRIAKKEVIAVGTHSHSKTKLFLKPLFGGGTKELVFAHTDNVEVVEVIKKTGQVISKSEQHVQLMDIQSFETMDADINLGVEELNEGDEVIFVEYNGKVTVLEKK